MSDGWQISAEDAEEYTRALGQIVSGGWRQVALAQRLGVPAALGLTTETWVRERIGGYVRLGIGDRREAVKELTDPDGEYQMSQRQAAEVLGVGAMTVNRDLQSVSDGTAEAPSLEDDSEMDVPDGTDEPADEAPREPTTGDVRDEIAALMDDAGAAEDIARNERLRTARNVRLGWLRFVIENPPGVLVADMGTDEIADVISALDRVIDWLEQARAVAGVARRPRKVGA